MEKKGAELCSFGLVTKGFGLGIFFAELIVLFCQGLSVFQLTQSVSQMNFVLNPKRNLDCYYHLVASFALEFLAYN